MASAPSFVTGVRIMMPLSVLNRVLDVPSMVFRHTLPVKPSVTMTSNFAGRMSPPSALPAKLGSCSFSSAWASWANCEPFASSSPMFSNAAHGFSMPTMRSA